MTLSKKIIIAIALLMLVIAVWLMGKPHSQKLVLNTKADCLEGRDAAMLTGGVIDTMNSPPKPGCPGYDKVSQGDVGTYKLGPYMFKIPRAYLWQGKYDEGKVEGLYFYIEYPSMKPAIKQLGEPGLHDELHVTLKYNNACPETPCESYSFVHYQTRALNQTNPTFKSEIAHPVFSKRFNLQQYNFEVGIPPKREEVYFTGDPYHPRSWYLCGVSMTSPGCRTTYKLAEGLWVTLIYSYSLFEQHENIKNALNQKLQQFITQGDIVL